MTVTNPNRFRRRMLLLLPAVAFLVFASLIPAARPAEAAYNTPQAVPAQTPAEPRIAFDPSEPNTTAGNLVTITANVFDKDGNKVEDATPNNWSWEIADSSLKEFLLVKKDEKEGNKLLASALTGTSGAARPSMIPIIVTHKGNPSVTGVVNVRLSDSPLARGPIPPGIDPQVDVMWAVMPQGVAHDNFGSKIKKQYYGIEVVIGNDSGYDLELASVGFDLGAGKGLETDGLASTKIPTSGYRVTRASLQRRQMLSPRNFILNTIKALGPVLTGFTPFFHNINHQSNFSEGINVLSNPIEKGIESVWPDTTLSQLANLEDQSLRDNAITRTVVKNNTQVRFVVFVPKDLISNGEKNAKWRDQPLEVMKRLGRIILVGDQVAHINRVRVVSEAEAGATFSISGRATDPCLEGVEGATVTLTQANGFSSTTKTDGEGKYNFNNVSSGLAYTVTIAKADTTFKPPVGNSFTLHGNRTGIDFFAEGAPFTIGGTIQKSDANDVTELESIKMVLTSQSATPKFTPRETNVVAGGKYKFENVPAGATYIVTPKLGKRKFTPKERRSITGPGCGEEEQDFDFMLEPEEKPKETTN